MIFSPSIQDDFDQIYPIYNPIMRTTIIHHTHSLKLMSYHLMFESHYCFFSDCIFSLPPQLMLRKTQPAFHCSYRAADNADNLSTKGIELRLRAVLILSYNWDFLEKTADRDLERILPLIANLGSCVDKDVVRYFI